MTGPIRTTPASPLAPEVSDDLLSLADDELVIGHRHSEWLGLSPFLEEDLSMASIAQDELGHARALYRLVWPDWDDRDAGVVRRPDDMWRSCSLVERRSPSWEFALVRHVLYDVAEPLRWQQLESDHGEQLPALHDLVENVRAEERFHLRHATDLVTRLGTANPQSRGRLQSALDDLWPDAEAMASSDGAPCAWAGGYSGAMKVLCERASLVLPASSGTPSKRSGRSSRHVDFAEISESLLAVFAFDPGATW